MPIPVPDRFTGQSLYAIFSIDTTATTTDIKKAYRRTALTVHPDQNTRPTANDEFAYITQAYQILSDSNKRAVYDESGSLDDAVDDDSTHNESFDTAYAYYRSMFPKITEQDIASYRTKYVGSTEERQDILHFWYRYNKLETLMECVPYSDSQQVNRYIGIINQYSEQQKCKLSGKQVDALVKKLQRGEKSEADEYAADQKGNAASEQSLVEMIRNKNSSKQQDAYFDSLAAKYGAMEAKQKGGKKKGSKEVDFGADPLDDAEFERIQAKQQAERAGKKKENVDSNQSSGQKRKRLGKR